MTLLQRTAGDGETMQKTGLLRFFAALIILTLTLALAAIPQPVSELVSAFCPVLLITLFVSMLLGPVYGLVIGTAAPALLSLILTGSVVFPDTVVEMTVNAVSALTAGICYRVFKTSLGASAAALIAGRAALAVFRILVSYFSGISYSLNDFFAEGVMDVLPGLISCLVILPLLMLAANKTGLKERLTHAPKEQYS